MRFLIESPIASQGVAPLLDDEEVQALGFLAFYEPCHHRATNLGESQEARHQSKRKRGELERFLAGVTS